MRYRNTGLVLVLVAAASAGCSARENVSVGGEASQAPGEAPKQGSVATNAAPEQESAVPVANALAKLPPLNVILISVDALRADMPWSGYSRDIAPNLKRFADENVVFENHRSLVSFTAQSVPAILSGRYASTLYRSGYFFAGYTDANEFFPELLQKRKIRTLGLHSHMYFNRGKGIDQGFDVWEMVEGITYNEKTDEHVTSPKTTKRLIELLSDEQNTGGRFFAWTHYTDPHAQYIKHVESPDFGRSERDIYDNEVHYTDRYVGEFLEWAQKQSFWDHTAVIISSDHGEAFGEHHNRQHAHELYEELVRVPLLVRIPGVKPRRIAAAHTHLDLAPTILELMGLEAPSEYAGKSLVGEMRGALPAADDPIVLELAADNIQEQRRALIHDGYKLIRFGSGKGYKHQLFKLTDDPAEKTDLSKREPEKLEELVALMDKTFAKIPSVAPFGGMKLKGAGTANGPMKPLAGL